MIGERKRVKIVIIKKRENNTSQLRLLILFFKIVLLEFDVMTSTCETSPIFGTSLSLAALLVLVSIILIIVVVLLARSRARALRQLESLTESTQRGNVTYEEINLPPVDIDTSKNVAYGHV